MRSVHTKRYTQYLKAAPVYGVHWCGLGSDHSDIYTAALQSRPQLNYQCSYKTCKNNNELKVSIDSGILNRYLKFNQHD